MCYRGEISAQREMLRFRHRYSGDPSATAESGAGCVWCLVVPVAEVGALRSVLQRISLQENEITSGQKDNVFLASSEMDNSLLFERVQTLAKS